MSSLLARTLGSVRSQATDDDTNKRSRGSPYARVAPPSDGWKHDLYGSSATDEAEARGEKRGGAGGGDRRRTKNLVISNLHYDVSERELEHLFVQVGPLKNAPSIKFDRSGRSTGYAYLGYATEKEAVEAKEAFDGALAKGQNIKVDFDTRVERVVPEPGTLLARLAADDKDSKPRRSDRSERSGDASTRFAAPAARRGGSGAVRGDRGVGMARRGGGPREGGGGGGREKREKRGPATTDDLDKELEAFMAVPAKEGEAAVPAPAASAAVVDVEMS
ncbi:hypothetical protein RQP46_007910 [Phenoliferia psychrophenolica]